MKGKKQKLTKREEALISLYAETMNETFCKCAGGHYVGETNIERELTYFLKAYKRGAK